MRLYNFLFLFVSILTIPGEFWISVHLWHLDPRLTNDDYAAHLNSYNWQKQSVIQYRTIAIPLNLNFRIPLPSFKQTMTFVRDTNCLLWYQFQLTECIPRMRKWNSPCSRDSLSASFSLPNEIIRNLNKYTNLRVFQKRESSLLQTYYSLVQRDPEASKSVWCVYTVCAAALIYVELLMFLRSKAQAIYLNWRLITHV